MQGIALLKKMPANTTDISLRFLLSHGFPQVVLLHPIPGWKNQSASAHRLVKVRKGQRASSCIYQDSRESYETDN